MRFDATGGFFREFLQEAGATYDAVYLGCGAAVAMKFVLRALGNKTIMVLPACCRSIIAGPYPQSTLQIPLIHSAFETRGAMASGVRAALDVKGDKETCVVTWAGDGGTFDIGFQALRGAVERNEDFICAARQVGESLRKFPLKLSAWRFRPTSSHYMRWKTDGSTPST